IHSRGVAQVKVNAATKQSLKSLEKWLHMTMIITITTTSKATSAESWVGPDGRVYHSHDGLAPHSHEPIYSPGYFSRRAPPLNDRNFSERAFTVGIGGPVGTGKTALMLALCRVLRDKYSLAAVTNDIFTKEDGEFLVKHGALPEERIRAVETGGCPHAAIREDISINLGPLEELSNLFKTDLLLCESGGDNLAANFSRELADYIIYIIDVSAGDKIPRKGGPGITQADLLVINKTDLAAAVGADLSVMERDALRMRDGGEAWAWGYRNSQPRHELMGASNREQAPLTEGSDELKLLEPRSRFRMSGKLPVSSFWESSKYERRLRLLNEEGTWPTKPTFRLLNGVKPARNNWLIRVKVLHSWKQSTSFGGKTFECVLADETVIGEWKTIDTFQVLAASGHYCPTNHQYELILLTKCDLLSDKIYLSLSSYDDLRNIDEKKNFFLKDIIGQVVDLNGVQTVQAMGKDKMMVQFCLRDCSGDEIVCCLWGKFAEQVETILENCNNERVIMLIRFAKIGFFRGEVQVTNAFDASIVDINPIYEEAIEFKEKNITNAFDASIVALNPRKEAKQIAQNKKEDWNEIEVRSISKILVAAEIESYKIICSIESVDTYWGWFYIGCKFVTDTAEIEDSIILPQPIESLVGKSFCFGISISNDNLNNGSITFKVSEVWSGDKIQKIESQTEPSSCFDTNSSTLSGGDVFLVDQNKESSFEGFSTPLLKRKEEDADLLDMTSTSKMKCTKMIKLEKTKTDE
ncbi:hypothetical protein HID58_062885, partial [Brassica napus]